jgi:two-component system, OmpR family, response regulator VicR
MHKILVADDQQDILLMMKTILTAKGFIVETDSSGIVFEQLDKNNLPDLILLDINLGAKNGGEICHQLKTSNDTKHIPVILVSGETDISGTAKKCGAEDYLEKPFKTTELVHKIFSVLKAA